VATWKKKIEKSVGGDIEAGEVLVEGMLLQPSGMVKGLVAKEVGGLAGAAIASRMGRSAEDATAPIGGTAAAFPDGPIVVGLTDRRLVAWSWAKLTGKPKELLAAVPRESVAAIDLEKQSATYRVTVTFGDGSSRVYEAPKLGNQAPELVEAFAGR